MSLKMLVRFEGWTFILRIFFQKPFKCSYVAIATFTTCKTLHMLPFLLILLQAFNTKNECLKGKISSYYYIPTLKSHVHTNGELWYWAFTFIDDGNKSWGSEVTIETLVDHYFSIQWKHLVSLGGYWIGFSLQRMIIPPILLNYEFFSKFYGSISLRPLAWHFFITMWQKFATKKTSIVSKAKHLIPNYKFIMTNKKVFFRYPLDWGHDFCTCLFLQDL